jgi:GT2 family glycosyltransferase/glycosyltransferase involved in cell wall biosynthesis
VGPGGLPPSDADRAIDRSNLTREALARAAELGSAGDDGAALRWLERAYRLAPGEPTVALSLASAALGQDDLRAADLFAGVARRDDVREAWLGLAAARRRLGDAAGAAAALAAALSRHVPTEVGALADAITREAGAPGWCGLSGDGRLIVRPTDESTDRSTEGPGRRAKGNRRDGLSDHPGGRGPDGGSAPIAVRLDDRALAARATKLPAGWERAHSVWVTTADGQELLGSPIVIRAIRRVAGCVTACEGGLDGWAWHPGDPDRDPELTVRAATGRRQLRLTAVDSEVTVEPAAVLARPRGFRVLASALAGMTGLLHVLDRDGNDLLGSPLDPAAERLMAVAASVTLSRLYPARTSRASRMQPSPPPAIPVGTVAPSPPLGVALCHRDADVVIPVHGGLPTVLACLDSVLASIPRGSRVVVVDDASPEPALRQALDALAARRRIVLIRALRNRGFAASANAGMAACAGRDVVLLNSDTLVPPGWLGRLSAAARAAPDIGTVTPLSNDASILSYPGPAGSNPVPDRAETGRLDALAQRTNGATLVDIPVGVGFCLYIRRDCLDAVGLLRADLFAQGYGEENDFCLRARHLGWRHVAAPGVFVAHVGGASFGAAAGALRARNRTILERLHPGYDRLVQDFAAADPLAPARRALDLARWRAARRRGQRAVILVTHEEGGGVERVIARSANAYRAAGRRPVVLRPSRLPNGSPAVTLDDGGAGSHPNLRFALPDELPLLLHLLKAERPEAADIHHLVGYDAAILALIERLGVPYDVHVHDYALFCPRIALVSGEKRYCGEPELPVCEACVADAGSLLGDGASVVEVRARSARLLDGARRVLAPSADAAVRINRRFPAIEPDVLAPEDDMALAIAPAGPRPPASQPCRICVVGAIGVHKGYDVLLACARDAAARRLKLEFVVVGHTIDDARLLATGRVFVTGEYRPDEAVALIRAQHASLALQPSIWPETWCFCLTEAWQAGLAVAAFDIGAPAERIRRTGRGLLLPLGLPPAGINNALLKAAGLTIHQGRC